MKIGKNTKIWQPSNVYGDSTEIGKTCMIGAFTEIQDKVKIGNNCRIHSHTFICSLVTIEDNCFIGHGVMFINDKYAPSRDPTKWEKTLIKEGASIGNNATILPCTIGKNALIGAGSVLTHDADSYGIYVGNPARKIGDVRNDTKQTGESR